MFSSQAKRNSLSLSINSSSPVKNGNNAKTLYDDALTLTGYGKFNITLLVVCGMCMFTLQTETLSSGYILASACDLDLTSGEKGLFTSIISIGLISGSHFWGFMTDTRGRKKVIQLSLLGSFLSTCFASLMNNFYLLITFRFFTGFFLSAPSAGIMAYLGEFNAIKYREKSLSWAFILLACGILLPPGMAWLIIPQDWNIVIYEGFEYTSWRIFMVVCGLPSFLSALALIPFPESPKFLLARGRRVKALNVLKTVYSINMGKRGEEYPVQDLDVSFVVSEKQENTSFLDFMKEVVHQTTPLFCHPYLKKTILIFILLFGCFACSTGLHLWFPEIINRIAVHNGERELTICQALDKSIQNINMGYNQTFYTVKNSTEGEQPCKGYVDTSVFVQNLCIGLGYVLSYLLIGLLIGRLGRKCILIFTYALPAISCFLLYFVTNETLIGILFFILLVVSGLASLIVNIATIDIFPTYIRAMAVCMSLMVGRLGNVVTSSILGILIDKNCEATFQGFTVLLIVCACLSFFLPETSKEEK